MDLPDDTPLVVIPPEAYAIANQMREIMRRDLDEMEMAEAAVAFQIGDVEMQLAVWSVLTYQEKDAWRKLRELIGFSRYIQTFYGGK